MMGKDMKTMMCLAGLCAAGSIAQADQSQSLKAFAISIQPRTQIVDSQGSENLQFSLEQLQTMSEMLGSSNDGSISFLIGNPGAGMNQGFGPQPSDLLNNQGRSQQNFSNFDSIIPKEDNLNIVPLPTAAIAGFGLLSGLAGIRYIRRHQK